MQEPDEQVAEQDIGHGVTMHVVKLDGVAYGMSYQHPSTKSPTGRCIGFAPFGPPEGWTVESLEPLTLHPSLACRICGHHGFVRDGRWVPAS